MAQRYFYFPIESIETQNTFMATITCVIGIQNNTSQLAFTRSQSRTPVWTASLRPTQK